VQIIVFHQYADEKQCNFVKKKRRMKKGLIALIAVGGILLIGFLVYYNAYNKAVALQEGVDEKWGNVQSAYQRRLDLIPNLMKTVKAAAKNEKDILTEVTRARAGIVEAKTPEDMELMGKKINTAINLMYEAYPNIQSNQNFRDFQVDLTGTENRIKRERDMFNEAVKEYNTHIRGFFTSMLLNRETFPKKDMFKAMSGAENAPEVNFD
jgi:LemA protein